MLNVTITSFSYKKGMPLDKTGNGGGYVFDCRGLPNPYKSKEYRHFSGNMPEIEEFFSAHPIIEEFARRIFATVEISIDNYIERDFDSLQISFGCTGGQHRSVYLAEQTEKYLAKKYEGKLIAQVIHREEKSWK